MYTIRGVYGRGVREPIENSVRYACQSNIHTVVLPKFYVIVSKALRIIDLSMPLILIFHLVFLWKTRPINAHTRMLKVWGALSTGKPTSIIVYENAARFVRTPCRARPPAQVVIDVGGLVHKG